MYQSDYYKKWYRRNIKKRKSYMKKYRNLPHVKKRRREWYDENRKNLKKRREEKRIAGGWRPKTDWLYTKKVCRHCKKGDIHLMKQSKHGSRQYYSCRPCNLERSKRYRGTERGADRVRRAVYRSIKKHPRKQRAREILNYYVKMGYVKKPKKCSICGKKRKIEAHHPNYNKPLEVVWTCRPCHTLL